MKYESGHAVRKVQLKRINSLDVLQLTCYLPENAESAVALEASAAKLFVYILVTVLL